MGVPSINGYADLTVIGQGGFAVVYRATQSALNRSVAVKVLSGLVDPVAISRFERECATIGSLSGHPHVVSVYDAGTTVEGSPYLAMEYVPRGSLADRIQASGPLPTPQILSVGVQLCDALDAAHRAGVLHRDIKPENVLVDVTGQCKLADFGVAAVVEGVDSRDTAPGTLLGTVLHLAPEVLEGGRAAVASDIYSLGSTLATLALGKAPFARTDDETVIPTDDADRPRPAARPAGGRAPRPRGRGDRDGDGQGCRRAVRIRRRVRQRAPADPEAHGRAGHPDAGRASHAPAAPRRRRVQRRDGGWMPAGDRGRAGGGWGHAARSPTGRRSSPIANGAACSSPPPSSRSCWPRWSGSSWPARTATTPPRRRPRSRPPPPRPLSPRRCPVRPRPRTRTAVAAAVQLGRDRGLELDVVDTNSYLGPRGLGVMVAEVPDGRRSLVVFYDGHVLGLDFTEPSWTVDIVDQTSESFTVDYALYAAGQAPPAAPIGQKRIAFVWDAERAKVNPQNGPVPPTDQGVDGHR